MTCGHIEISFSIISICFSMSQTQQNIQCEVNNWVQYLFEKLIKIKGKVLWQVFSLTNSRTLETPTKYIYKQKNKFHVCCKIIEKKTHNFFAMKSECWWRKRNKMKQIFNRWKVFKFKWCERKDEREKLNNKIISITTFQPISGRSVLLEWEVSLIKSFAQIKVLFQLKYSWSA